jgi:hypothetical protein
VAEPSIFARLLSEILWLPMRLAFRLVWLMALVGNRSAEDVYLAMWSVNLNLPPINRLKALRDAVEPSAAQPQSGAIHD